MMIVCRGCGLLKDRDTEFYKGTRKCKACRAQYVRDNRESINASTRRRQQKPEYKEKEAARGRRNYEQDKERFAIRNQAWRDANPEKVAEYHRQWRARNPEAVRALNHKRKARRAGAKGSHTKAEIKELLQQQNNLCANPYCRIDISGVDPKTGRSMRHLDHIVPLVKGGSNSIENLQWLCITCNTSKHDKDQDEWLEEFAKVAKVKARKAA